MKGKSRIIQPFHRVIIALTVLLLRVHPVGAQTAPQLGITNGGSQATIFWPMADDAFALQWTTNLTPPVPWQTFSTRPGTNAGNFVMSLSATNAREFFRLAPIVAPTVATKSANNINFDSAVLNGSVNPGNDVTTTAYFDYGPTTNYEMSTAHIGIGVLPQTFSLTIPALNAVTTYHYRIVAMNSRGTNYGADTNFITGVSQSGQAAPGVQTLSATNNFLGALAFAANVNTQDAATHVYFQFGFTADYGYVTGALSVSGNASIVSVALTPGPIIPSTLYHFRPVAFNSGGTSFGNDLTFESPGP